MKKTILTFSAIFLLSAPVFAHSDHKHGSSGESASGSLNEIVLTETMIANLGIQTVPAVQQDMAKTIDLIANVDYLPEKQAIISARAEGSISAILVRAGEQVKKGDKVAVLQPRLVGNPPVTLTSPMNGYVTEQNVVLGQSVTPDQPLLRIADLSEVLVSGQAYEDIPQTSLTAGRPVFITTASFPGEIFEGTLQRVDASFRPGTRVRQIWAAVENPEGKLLANMQAQLSIQIGDPAKALIVPQRAVLGDTGNYFVYVRKDDHFYRRDVKLGQKFGSMREILAGVRPNEQVVTVGNYQLQFVTPADADNDNDHGHSH